MAEYIRKDHAINLARASDGEHRGKKWLVRQLEMIHPADVRPVVRGRWELDSRSMYSCSCCGRSAPYDVQADIIEYWPNLNYCPNCGSYNGGDISVDE